MSLPFRILLPRFTQLKYQHEYLNIYLLIINYLFLADIFTEDKADFFFWHIINNKQSQKIIIERDEISTKNKYKLKKILTNENIYNLNLIWG